MKDNSIGVLLEEIRDQNKVVLEAVGDMQEQLKDLAPLKADVAELKSDMKVVKAAVTDQSRQVHDHEQRITRLESATS
jgi:hypothetical protein